MRSECLSRPGEEEMSDSVPAVQTVNEEMLDAVLRQVEKDIDRVMRDVVMG